MLVEDLSKNVSTGKQTDLVLLDFSNAFNKINHSTLIWKLHQYGMRETALAWIRAFLSNRSQTVVLEGEEPGSVPRNLWGSSGFGFEVDSVSRLYQRPAG